MSRQSPSLVEYFAEREKHKCGYCKSPDTNCSHGMWAYTLKVQDYQDLINRGWRRSGNYCYKPIMDQTCCPMYTIKCEALGFKISKSQKKLLKKMSKFLKGELKRNDTALCDELLQDDSDSHPMQIQNCAEQVEKARKNATKIDMSLIADTFDLRLPSLKNSTNSQSVIGSSYSTAKVKHDKNPTPISSPSKDYKSGMGFDQSKPPPKKAKIIRRERKQNKLLSMGKSTTEVEEMLKQGKSIAAGKTLEELFIEESVGQNKLELRLVRTSPMSSEYINTSEQSYELYKKYQMTIHKDRAEQVTQQQYTRFLVESPLQIKLVSVSSEEFLDTFELSANLYKKYQMAVHKDSAEECDKQSFTEFLCKSPLQKWVPADGPPQGYGSFHQQYWLNNQLIAVGVIDILPSCISSVYFFYDPIYSHISLGTYGSLREIMLTRQLNKVVPNLKYYYMGFYIHTCPKMRYKAGLRPSKLLCPETYVWCDIENCLPKLDKEKYSRLNEDLDAIDENLSNDITQVSVCYNRKIIPYHVYKKQAHSSADQDEIREYSHLVGARCAQNLALYRS
ncbi:arginyl-tRNA--protein transferase 1 isoform X1 [Diprion similis]|uniref:arginyl-tRNA--protein transferase 1 isoform X1 n=2 Tax=Diprion similis TaxID=362088 RepID=UPI001EF87C2E|nr:arginyl-tRNA--protein transferase 1 isoform X1 [Diprion similis]XP_046752564.1 arginyl-tRNA--protein transferase 1 isoform X1 [Diprion similis]